MLAKLMTGSICFLVILSSCTSRMHRLPVATAQVTPETVTATATAAITPPATATSTFTPTPKGSISPDNLKQVKLLHFYWLAVATAAGVDPHEMDISAVATSPDGSLIAVGGCSQPLEADLRSGSIYCNGGDSENAGAVPFLLILDANTESVVQVIPENQADTTIADLAFTPDGEKLIYAVYPGKFVIWDVTSKQIESTLWEGETSAPRVAISPNGAWIALKTTDQVEIWDVANKEFVAELPAFYRPQFSADNKQVAVYSNRAFIVYDTGTWMETLRFGMPCDCIYALSPSLSLLATSERASEAAPILIWDTSSGVQIQSLAAGKSFTSFLAFTPDGQMLWRASDRGDLTAWGTSEWNFLAENIGGITPIFNLHGFQFVANGQGYMLFSDLLLALYGLP